MILIKSLKLTNFLSHQDTYVEFKDTQKSIITGSSGVGKSSILDAISWVLYGESRAPNTALIRKGAVRAEVQLRISRTTVGAEAQETFVITRSATTAGKHVLEIATEKDNGLREAMPVSGIKAGQEWIERELIGASYALYANSVAYVQNSPMSFVTQPAPRRKELLLEIVGAEDFDKYYEGARKGLQEAEKAQEGINGQLLELNASQAALLARITPPEAQEKIILDATIELADLGGKKKLLEAEKATFAAAQTTLALLERNIETAEKEFFSLNASIILKKQKVANKPALEAKLFNETVIKSTLAILEPSVVVKNEEFVAAIESGKKRDELAAKKPFDYSAGRNESARQLRVEIAQLKEKPICPAGEACPYGGNIQKHITEKEVQIGQLVAANILYADDQKKWESDMAQLPAAIDKDKILKEIRSIEAEINEQKNSLRQVAFVKMELESLASIEAEIVELNKSLEEKGKQIETLRKERIVDLACLDAERVKLVDHELYQVVMSEKLANEKLTRAMVALETLKLDKEQYDLGTTRQIALAKERISLNENIRKLQLVKDAFGSKGGIQTIIIDYVLPRLEEKINIILGKLSDFKVRLDTQKATADGDGVVEGLWITIVNEVGQEMDFANYSGGEKVRISIAIAEALASLSKKVGFRLLDEAVMSLSAEMTEQFVEVLGEMLNQYPQILAISHLPEVQEVFDHQLKVHKNNGVSHVE